MEDTQVLTEVELVKVLNAYGFPLAVRGSVTTPGAKTFELEVSPLFRLSSFESRAKDIALALGTEFRVLSPYRRGSIGLEIPLPLAQYSFEDALKAIPAKASPLALPLGISAESGFKDFDLAKAPHLLVAGSTGSGKSSYLKTVIETLRRRNTPETVRIVLIDIKGVDFTKYEGDGFLYNPFKPYSIITNAKQANSMLETLIKEMYQRLEALKKAGVANIAEYLALGKKMPYVVLIVDEYAELCSGTEKEKLENSVQRLGQLARSVGIHLILATQHPIAEIVSTAIKVNFPVRISFRLPAKSNYLTVIGSCPPMLGAEPAGSAWVKLPEAAGISHVQSCLPPTNITLVVKEAPPVINDEPCLETSSTLGKHDFKLWGDWEFFVAVSVSSKITCSFGKNLIDVTEGTFTFEPEYRHEYGMTPARWARVMEKGVEIGFIKTLIKNSRYFISIAGLIKYYKEDKARIEQWNKDIEEKLYDSDELVDDSDLWVATDEYAH